MSSYRDLEIYKISYDLALRVHKLSLKLPKFELYEEGSQVRKSSKGIPACIVEGYGRRKYKAEFVKFLVYAQASCDETRLHLDVISDTHPEVTEECRQLFNEYEKLGGMQNRFIQYVEKSWRTFKNG